MDQKKQGMGLLAVMLAGIFLFHPIIAGIDLLPDLIGYCLLFFGLSKLADLNGHLTEARRRFGIMTFVGAGQIFATYLVYGMIGGMMRERPAEMSVYEGPMLTLLFAFVLLVLQWIFLISAQRELFLGLDMLATRLQASDLLRERRGRTLGERMARLSTVFIILSSLLSLLPEATVLTSYEAHKGNPLFPFDWYEYVELFRLMAGVLSLIVGTIWLISYLRYLSAFRRNSQFMEQSNKAYEETVLPQTGMLTVRRFSAAFLLFTIGSIFSIAARINDRALAPGIVFAILVMIGLAVLGKRAAHKKQCVAAAILLSVVSLTQLIVNNSYLSKHLPEASLYETDAYWHYFAVRALDAVEAIATLVLVAALLSFLYGLIQAHSEVNYGTKESEALSKRATARQHRAFKKRMLALLALFSASAIGSVLDAAFRMELDWIWIVSFVLSMIGIWCFYSLVQDICEQIRFYYHSDGVNKNI